MDRGLIDSLNNIPGYLFREEGEELLRLARETPGDAIEIGSWKGRSTCYLAMGKKLRGSGKVIAVDHFKGSPEHQNVAEVRLGETTEAAFRENIKTHELGTWVRYYAYDSERALTLYGKIEGPGKAGLLFIDAEHTYAAVEVDFRLWEPMVMPGGVIALHDYGNNEWPDVSRFIDGEIISKYREISRVGSLISFQKP